MLKSIAALVLGLSITACGTVDQASESKTSIRHDSACIIGNSYSRVVVGTGISGSPSGEFIHTLSFNNNWTVLDNGDTFFGNLPRLEDYSGFLYEITIGEDVYTLSRDCLTLTRDNVVFTKAKNQVIIAL